jgi:hypothetical protein
MSTVQAVLLGAMIVWIVENRLVNALRLALEECVKEPKTGPTLSHSIQTSECLRHFGWEDFDPARLDEKSHECPVKDARRRFCAFHMATKTRVIAHCRGVRSTGSGFIQIPSLT